jgi:N-ethylmaleimide reductase
MSCFTLCAAHYAKRPSTQVRVETSGPIGSTSGACGTARSSGAGRADINHQNVPSALELFRSDWSGVLIGAGGFDGASAEAAVASGEADAIAFGRAFIANPDLPMRLKFNIPLSPYNRATFYGGGAAGYTDYSRYDT